MKDVYEQMMARQQRGYPSPQEIYEDANVVKYSEIMGTSIDVRRAEEIGWFSERLDLTKILEENNKILEEKKF